MNNLPQNVTLPAEWDARVSSILLSFPHAGTDWNYMLNEARDCFIKIIRELVGKANVRVILVTPDRSETLDILRSRGIETESIEICETPTDDTWARDFGPITVFSENGQYLLDFKFNGWGLKFRSAADNMICRNIFGSRQSNNNRNLANCQDFVLEGGSIESDGEGTILTTSECLLSPNRNAHLDRKQIEEVLRQRLGAKRILWLNHGFLEGDDTDSHIDTLARFANASTIIYVSCDDLSDVHYTELKSMEDELKTFTTLDGQPYKLIALPLPHPVYDEEGCRVPATYANFLITPTTVLLPVYNQPDKDSEAIKIIKEVFPTRNIVPVDCSALIRQHGSLHCVTMQMYI